MQILPEGPIKRIHVNQSNLRNRLKEATQDPCYTIKYKGLTLWAYEVDIKGPSRMVERIDNPLGCGARLWIETTAELELVT